MKKTNKKATQLATQRATKRATIGAQQKQSNVAQAHGQLGKSAKQFGKAPYPFPIPERDALAAKIAATPEGLSLAGLIAAFKFEPHEVEGVSRRVSAMERDGQLRMNARGVFTLVDSGAPVLPPKKTVEEAQLGRVSANVEGYGFITPKGSFGKANDVFINQREMRNCLHGDTVRYAITGLDRRGRAEGRVLDIVSRGLTKLVGALQKNGQDWCVMPEDKRVNGALILDYTSVKATKTTHPKLAEGTLVEALIDIYPTATSDMRGHIVEVLGEKDDAGIEIEVALRKHDLPHRFSPETLAEAEALPDLEKKTDITKELKAGRRDIRALPLVTIDGEDARDFDDAVYAEPLAGSRGFRLVVAIADVSHYVKVGQPLDGDARDRSTSVYFPRRVIPMLPEKLSNGLCSLNPNVDRMVMVCDMQVSATGVIKAYEFYPGVMHSQARFTYTEVAVILAEPTSPAAQKRDALVGHLQCLHKLFKALLQARAKRGAIEFETTETMMLFNANGKIDEIVPRTRNDAHRLIEECMLAANVCAAEYLLKAEHPALYRVHLGPTEFKLDNLREFLGPLSLTLGGGGTPKTSDYAKLALQVRTRPDAALIQMVMLRSMQQAVYTPDNNGHFGLAYEAYAHFTSPIRRYPDLTVHRAIKAVLKGTQYEEPDWGELGALCSAHERRADEASREVEQYLKCFFMQDKVGEIYAGTVASVVHFGLFVVLTDFYVEGLVHIRDLGRDYFTHDEAKHQLRGERSGQVFSLGLPVTVKVASVNMETSKIDFVMAAGEKLSEGPKKLTGIGSSAIAPVTLAPTKPARKRVMVEVVVPKEPESVVKRLRRSW